jgi:hypothetical protein
MAVGHPPHTVSELLEVETLRGPQSILPKERDYRLLKIGPLGDLVVIEIFGDCRCGRSDTPPLLRRTSSERGGTRRFARPESQRTRAPVDSRLCSRVGGHDQAAAPRRLRSILLRLQNQ